MRKREKDSAAVECYSKRKKGLGEILQEALLQLFCPIVLAICDLGDIIMDGDNIFIRILAYLAISVPCFIAFYFLVARWFI